MKRFGTMIIKPDAFNYDDLKMIGEVLSKYGVYEDNLCFPFENFSDVILEYRKKDISFKHLTNVADDLPEGMVKQSPETELKYCKVAVAAYEKFFKDKKAVVLLLPMPNRSDKDYTSESYYREFFEAMYKAKREIRDRLKASRSDCYAYVDYDTENQEMRRLSKDEYESLKQQKERKINLAHVDGIHLEDNGCFENNFCMSFMIAKGIIKKSNQVSLSQLIESVNNSNPQP